MACNCKTNEQILKLHRKYGNTIRTSWKERINFRFSEGMKLLLIYLMTIIFFPFILLFAIIVIINGKGKINVNKTLKLLLGKKGDE